MVRDQRIIQGNRGGAAILEMVVLLFWKWCAAAIFIRDMGGAAAGNRVGDRGGAAGNRGGGVGEELLQVRGSSHP